MGESPDSITTCVEGNWGEALWGIKSNEHLDISNLLPICMQNNR